MARLHPLQNLLFIDVKTAPLPTDNALLQAWVAQRAQARDEGLTPEEWLAKHGALYAEVAQVTAIALGYLHREEEDDGWYLRQKVITNGTEHELLTQLVALLLRPRFADKDLRLVAHNGKEFDIPFLSRRLVAHGLNLPKPLNMLYKKSYENPSLDTLEMWRFGERRHFISLPVLAAVLGLADDPALLEHNKRAHAAWEAEDWPELEAVCNTDIALLVNIFLRLNGYGPLAGVR